MSDHSRGPYTPGSEPPLAFDDRRPRRGGGGPAPVTLIISLLLLAGVGGGVFLMYRGGARAPGGAPAPVGAPIQDVKIAAPPEAPAPDPAAGLSIYKDNPGAGAAQPAFVPPPEQPTPRPVAGQPAAPTATPSVAAPSAAQTPTAAASLQKPPAAVEKASANAPTIDRILADNSDVKSPVKPLVKPVAKPQAVVEAKPVAKPATTADAKADPGPAIIQIGAFSSKALADAGWNAAAGAAPGGMAGKGKRVVPVTKADGTTLYRTSITGFSSHAEAVALCAKLKAAGESCFVR